MIIPPDAPIRSADTEIPELREFLTGLAAGLQMAGRDDTSQRLRRACTYFDRFRGHICGQGYVCHGGPKCTSDHK